ncbi:MAG: hypothetical protein RLZZ272_1019 [Actinomycetota bacterium]
MLAVVTVGALAVGIGVGRTAVPDPGTEARLAVEATALPLALDADAIWTSGALGAPAVAEGIGSLVAGDPSVVGANAAAWLEAHDSVLVRLAGIELPATARPVQRQLLNAVALSRDAVEVLDRAAAVGPGPQRDDLIIEVVRLRQRSEGLLLAARASVEDLDGAGRRIALPAPVPPFPGSP